MLSFGLMLSSQATACNAKYNPPPPIELDLTLDPPGYSSSGAWNQIADALTQYGDDNLNFEGSVSVRFDISFLWETQTGIASFYKLRGQTLRQGALEKASSAAELMERRRRPGNGGGGGGPNGGGGSCSMALVAYD